MRARDYQPGEQVPGTVYKVLRLIGAGGMGTVYDVEDTTIGKRYVLKTLRPKLGAREDLARRIQNEARILARLHHPNIVEVITAGITADATKLPYYLMERLNGQSLRVILEKKGRLELTHAYHIGIDLLDALDHAHDKSVIHRDVKPDNIFLHRTNAGVTLTKLLDFGIVSMLDQDGETAGRFLGTLRYAAPEQLRGEKPTAKTDVYAAGLVLYEMIAGRGPFDDEGDGNRVAAAHLHKFPLPVSQFVPVPHELDVLLMAALAKNPEARPRDAFSFAASLRNLKRAVEDVQAREATENRVTAAAVLGPESGAALPTAGRSSSSSVDDAGAPAAPPGTGSSAGSRDKTGPTPTVSPKTTLVGMPTPTRPPSPAQAAAFASTTIDDGRGRGATTNTMGPDTIPTPQHGTEVLPPLGPVHLEDVRLGEASTELQWPRDRAPILSDEPQIRSLPVSGVSSRRLRPAAFLALGGAVIVTLAVATHRAPRSAASVGATAPLTAVAPTTSPIAPPVLAAAASVPAVSAPVPAVSASVAAAALVASPVVPAALAVSAASPVPGAPHPKAIAPLAKAGARRVPPSTYAIDRPGPGF